MLKSRFLPLLFAALFFAACAKRGSITGGAKDTIPPVLTSSSPENMTTDFKGSEIRINFNEYIKIKDVSRQLIISPPMDTPPVITPIAGANKYIDIKIKDTLQPNTTYSFNFGQSITDNNEGNPYSQFRFVFSTGPYIDSLTVNGRIKDAYSLKPDNFVTIMLYEATETFSDSTIYKERPRYVTNTLDSLVNYSLQNLKEGKYHLFAMKDMSNDYKFNPRTDKIAFLKAPIAVPTDTVYELELFQQKLPFKPLKPVQASSGRLFAPYEGDHRGMEVTVKNGQGTETIPSITTKVREADSLQVWLPRNLVADSLQVAVSHKDSVKNFTVRFQEMKAADSLSVEAEQKGSIHFRERFTLRLSTPVTAIDSTKIRLIDKDSAAVSFTYAYREMEQELEFDFKKEENQKYTFRLLPEALIDFYGQQNDSLTFPLTTRTYSDYGNMRLQLQNAARFPVLVEIVNSNDKVEASYYSEGETHITFDAILPDEYILRAIYDDNRNGEWDTGDYMEKRQPEEVIYSSGKIKVMANWDVEEPFNLGG